MIGKQEEGMIAGLNIGSTNIHVTIAKWDKNHSLYQIVGYASTPNRGVQKGAIIDLDATAQAIRSAVMKAENVAGCSITEIHTGFSSAHIESAEGVGIVGIKGGEVALEDLELLVDSARDLRQAGNHILHIQPKKYLLDQAHVRNPLGLSGQRLEGRFHIVLCKRATVDHFTEAVFQAGLDVVDVFFSPIAACEAVLSGQDRGNSFFLINMGGATTGFVVLEKGDFIQTGLVPLGGRNVTRDIAQIFNLSLAAAEQVKLAYSGDYTPPRQRGDADIDHSETSKITEALDDPQLTEVIAARSEEIFFEVKKAALLREDIQLPHNVVLTGGASQLYGATEHAQNILGCQVEIGDFTLHRSVMDAKSSHAYASAIGLTFLADKNRDSQGFGSAHTTERKKGGLLSKTFSYLKSKI